MWLAKLASQHLSTLPSFVSSFVVLNLGFGIWPRVLSLRVFAELFRQGHHSPNAESKVSLSRLDVERVEMGFRGLGCRVFVYRAQEVSGWREGFSRSIDGENGCMGLNGLAFEVYRLGEGLLRSPSPNHTERVRPHHPSLSEALNQRCQVCLWHSVLFSERERERETERQRVRESEKESKA